MLDMNRLVLLHYECFLFNLERLHTRKRRMYYKAVESITQRMKKWGGPEGMAKVMKQPTFWPHVSRIK